MKGVKCRFWGRFFSDAVKRLFSPAPSAESAKPEKNLPDVLTDAVKKAAPRRRKLLELRAKEGRRKKNPCVLSAYALSKDVSAGSTRQNLAAEDDPHPRRRLAAGTPHQKMTTPAPRAFTKVASSVTSVMFTLPFSSPSMFPEKGTMVTPLPRAFT